MVMYTQNRTHVGGMPTIIISPYMHAVLLKISIHMPTYRQKAAWVEASYIANMGPGSSPAAQSHPFAKEDSVC